MGSGNVAPAPVMPTPWNPPLLAVPPPPHAAARSTTAATAAVAAMYRLNLRMLPPSFLSWGRPRVRILGIAVDVPRARRYRGEVNPPESGCERRVNSRYSGANRGPARSLSLVLALLEKRLHPPADLVTDLSDPLDGLVFRVGQAPVLHVRVQDRGAGLVVDRAAHRDRPVRRPDDLVGQQVASMAGHIDPGLPHRLDHHGARRSPGHGPGALGLSPTVREGAGEALGHHAAAGVVHTDEQDALHESKIRWCRGERLPR